MDNTNKAMTTRAIWAWFSTGLNRSLPWSHIYYIYSKDDEKCQQVSSLFCSSVYVLRLCSVSSSRLCTSDAVAGPTHSPSLLRLSSVHVFLPFLTHIEFMRLYLAMLPTSLVRFGVSAVPLGFIRGLKFSFHLQGLKQPHKQHLSECAAQTRTDKETDKSKICV